MGISPYLGLEPMNKRVAAARLSRLATLALPLIELKFVYKVFVQKPTKKLRFFWVFGNRRFPKHLKTAQSSQTLWQE